MAAGAASATIRPAPSLARQSLDRRSGSIGKHRSDPPVEQCLRPVGIVDGIGEQWISRFADLGDQGRAKAAVVGMDRRAAEPLGNRAPVLRNGAEQYAAGDCRCASPRRRERILRESSRSAAPAARRGHSRESSISHHRPGLRFAAARGLQLDIRAETELGEERSRLLQRRHALPGEGRREPAAGVVASDRCQGQRADLAAPVGRALAADRRAAGPAGRRRSGEHRTRPSGNRAPVASRKPASVFSGALAAAPRWPITARENPCVDPVLSNLTVAGPQ